MKWAEFIIYVEVPVFCVSVVCGFAAGTWLADWWMRRGLR